MVLLINMDDTENIKRAPGAGGAVLDHSSLGNVWTLEFWLLQKDHLEFFSVLTLFFLFLSIMLSDLQEWC